MAKRVHNFNAGPAALPMPVLERMRDEMLDWQGTDMSVLEVSHRSKPWEAFQAQATADIKTLLGAGDDYAVLFMGGGARTHFALVPMNLRPKGAFAEYAVTGNWAEGACKEAKKLGDAREIFNSAGTKHDRVPEPGSLKVSRDAAYFHYTCNNTVEGTEWHYVPDTGGATLVCDMSSDFMSRPVDVKKYGLIYAGAQKNVGPAGVVIIVIRKDLLARSAPDLPEMFSYAKVEKESSLLNTPPVYAIYTVGLVAKHLLAQGGLAAVEKLNQQKADLLYGALEASGGYYKPHAQKNSRSLMNVTFRLPTTELEEKLAAESKKAGMEGLKGHRSVGGMRASIYNAVSIESVKALVEFLGDFKKRNG